MAKKAKKKSPKKKATKKPHPVTAYEYFVDEWPTTSSTQDMQNRANQIGSEGWQLLFVGTYGGTPGNIRVWYMRER